MPYKTIVVQADCDASAADRYRTAAMLARQNRAHLVGVASAMHPIWLDRFQRRNDQLDLDSFLSALESEATKALDGFLQAAREHEVESVETRCVHDDMSVALALQATHADLAVLSRPGSGNPGVIGSATGSPALAAMVAMQSGAPVLMVPSIGGPLHAGRPAVVAWKVCPEARRALHFSLPLLRHASQVHVAVVARKFEIEPGKPREREPGGDIALFLARHGLKVEVHQLETRGEVGETLLGLADDVHAELLVMGCYGHHRYREYLLGGVTRDVLTHATLPVLMAH
ncbi:universal stress protein [Noviherbaspirillum galbum]|uniref:Universal stress protein n=1 Tax=Noviherbaspirillum galbum TaxID=2709383 RepID=A0A6B3SN81_9BURK|nr:universal stress protein [Noviherbaspirillum galbum]NEX62360.1 universal stress protein [Noviherbaspirillum galbum]